MEKSETMNFCDIARSIVTPMYRLLLCFLTVDNTEFFKVLYRNPDLQPGLKYPVPRRLPIPASGSSAQVSTTGPLEAQVLSGGNVPGTYETYTVPL